MISFFDFLKKVKSLDESLEKVLKEKFNVNQEILEKIKEFVDLEKSCKELEQRELDRIYRILFEEVSEEKEEVIEERKIEKEKKKVRRRWYERWYYWFISSEGFLVVRGKNEKQNLTIFRRWVKESDVLFFEESDKIFTVLKNDQEIFPLPPNALIEAAEFACAFSNAWKEKREKTSIKYIIARNVKFDGEEFIFEENPKEIEKIKPKLSIGIKIEDKNGRIVYGPPTAVKKQTPFFVTIVPGERRKEELAKEIKRQLTSKVYPEMVEIVEKIEEKEIEKIIPFGIGEIVR